MKTYYPSMPLKLVLGLLSVVFFSQAEAACQVSRNQVLADIKAGVKPAEITKKYVNCTPINDITIGAAAIPTNFKTWYEEIRTCGYQPQRKEAACTVNINQNGGYAGFFPAGSLEFVKLCVDYGGGLTPVNVNGFHVNDRDPVLSGNPVWNFAAIVPADVALFAQPLNRRALRARAILSWNMPPAGTCAAPIMPWGNVVDFRIRLDP